MNPITKAVEEKRLQFFENGSYKYIPSQEYKDKYQNENKEKAYSLVESIKKACPKLTSIAHAMKVGENRGQRLVCISENKFIFTK
jgi:hypothetical protein